MPRSSLVRTHLAAAAGALALIATFLVSSAVTELIGTAATSISAAVDRVRAARAHRLPGHRRAQRAPSGAELPGRGHPPQAAAHADHRRGRIVVLVPCALILDDLTASASAGGVVTALEIAEILAGALNLTLLVLNFRDGRGLTRPGRPARRREMVDTGP